MAESATKALSAQTQSSPPCAEFPVKVGSSAPAGLRGVVVGETEICRLDDQDTGLLYRGYDLVDLVQSCCFEEVIHLLLSGELPTVEQLGKFETRLTEYRQPPASLITLVKTMPRAAKPMSVLQTATSALGCCGDGDDARTLPNHSDQALRFVARLPSIVGQFDAHRNQRAGRPANSGTSHAAYVLSQFTGEEASPDDISTLDKALIIHAEHEFNASCFSARVTASTLGDFAAALSAAMGTLSGPLHGGANEQVLLLTGRIGHPDAVGRFVDHALSRSERIPGFDRKGYRYGDPRVAMLRHMAEDICQKKGNNQLLAILKKLDETVHSSSGLWPNIDLYSAAVFHSLGVSRDLFTPLFACARAVGWSAHIVEQQHNNRLIRPVANYIGPDHRSLPDH